MYGDSAALSIRFSQQTTVCGSSGQSTFLLLHSRPCQNVARICFLLQSPAQQRSAGTRSVLCSASMLLSGIMRVRFVIVGNRIARSRWIAPSKLEPCTTYGATERVAGRQLLSHIPHWLEGSDLSSASHSGRDRQVIGNLFAGCIIWNAATPPRRY